MRYGALLLSLFLLLSSCINEPEERTPSTPEVAVGDTLPAFQVVMDDGSQLSPAALRGKASVIVFFNTECTDCQQELPVLNAFYLAHAGDPRFRMACISRAQGRDDILAYWSNHHLELPFSAQEDKAVFYLFAQSRIPHIYISDADCTVRYIHDDRDMPSLQTLEQELRQVAPFSTELQ